MLDVFIISVIYLFCQQGVNPDKRRKKMKKYEYILISLQAIRDRYRSVYLRVQETNDFDLKLLLDYLDEDRRNLEVKLLRELKKLNKQKQDLYFFINEIAENHEGWEQEYLSDFKNVIGLIGYTN